MTKCGMLLVSSLVPCPHTATTCKTWFLYIETLSCTVWWGCYYGCSLQHFFTPSTEKKLSKLLKYVSDSWKHTWEKLASLSRPQQLLLPAAIVHNSRGGAPRFTDEYSAIWCIDQNHKLKQIHREIHLNCTLSSKILNPFSSQIQVWFQHKYISEWVLSANWQLWTVPDMCLTNTKRKWWEIQVEKCGNLNGQTGGGELTNWWWD